MTNYSPLSYIIYVILIIRTLIVAIRPNWLTAWILLEINILRFMPLITMTKSNQETEAATKYFLAQALGSLILLLAATIIYIPGISYIIVWTLIISLLIKLGAAPCHFWYPTVIASLSWSNCMILSTWQKLAPLLLITSVVTQDGDLSDNSYTYIIYTIAVINTTTGGIIGINQTHLRPLLAYSSIGHIGWIISGLAVNKACLTFAYFVIYSSLVVPIFILLILINTKTTHSLHRIFKTGITLPLVFILLILSLGGLPPLTGFFPKIVIIHWLATSRHVIVLLILIGSCINLYYYLNIRIAVITSINNWNLKSYNTSNIILPIIIGSTSILGAILETLNIPI